jgi:hypothetical protein
VGSLGTSAPLTEFLVDQAITCYAVLPTGWGLCHQRSPTASKLAYSTQQPAFEDSAFENGVRNLLGGQTVLFYDLGT